MRNEAVAFWAVYRVLVFHAGDEGVMKSAISVGLRSGMIEDEGCWVANRGMLMAGWVGVTGWQGWRSRVC